MSRVLIVEDEEHLAAGLKLNLEAEGFVAEVEENGAVALERLVAADPDAGRFDVVLLDVMLPGLDGFEVVRRLRAAQQYVPVMLLTARSSTTVIAPAGESLTILRLEIERQGESEPCPTRSI